MNRNVRLLRACYWFGAIVDGLMVIPMLVPSLAGRMFQIESFEPGVAYRYASMVGASLMIGWTTLLLWADRRPVARKAVLLMTVCPVVLGLAAAGAYAVAAGLITTGRMVPTWVLQAAILTTFTYVYFAAGDEPGRG
jgi:hypothetical protein